MTILNTLRARLHVSVQLYEHTHHVLPFFKLMFVNDFEHYAFKHLYKHYQCITSMERLSLESYNKVYNTTSIVRTNLS